MSRTFFDFFLIFEKRLLEGREEGSCGRRFKKFSKYPFTN